MSKFFGLKHFNFKKKIILYVLIIKYVLFTLKSLKNYLWIIFNNKFDNLYIPNTGINNVIMINPNKIEYINSIPLKFNKKTKLILDFDWHKTNKKLNSDYNHPTFVTCFELFVEGKKIEQCRNYFYFKNQILKNKVYKNCKNHDDIIKFLRKKKELFKSIKKR